MAAKRLAEYGDVLQIAYVPDDFRGAIRHWTACGAGPFFVREGHMLKNTSFRGKPVDLQINLAIGYWGDVQVELIEQLTPDPSTYREWSQAGRSGVHHLGFATTDIAGARAACVAQGLEIVQEAVGNGQDIFYARDPDWRETMLEFISLNPRRRDLFVMMREAHRTWDGSDPVRPG
jgi:methylmalonyl-CoA/ethylmalonyl-CoA epimerase